MKKLSEKSSGLSTLRIMSINCDNMKVFSNTIIMLEYAWYATHLCSEAQESGRQQPVIVKSLKVNRRTRISKSNDDIVHVRRPNKCNRSPKISRNFLNGRVRLHVPNNMLLLLVNFPDTLLIFPLSCCRYHLRVTYIEAKESVFG